MELGHYDHYSSFVNCISLGLGFRLSAGSYVYYSRVVMVLLLTKLATKSRSAGVTAMVPNSLGLAKLLRQWQ